MDIQYHVFHPLAKFPKHMCKRANLPGPMSKPKYQNKSKTHKNKNQSIVRVQFQNPITRPKYNGPNPSPIRSVPQ
ncbi:hypothetical protein V6Z11_A01G153100 [Gossypium hirsutum]